MFRSILLSLSLILLVGTVSGQEDPYQVLKQAVGEHHPELQALRWQMKQENFRRLADNRPDDLQLSGFYLPFGQHATADYWEYQIEQRLEWPGVYRRRAALHQSQEKVELLHFQKRKASLQQEAYALALEAVYLHKKLKLRKLRKERDSDDTLSRSSSVYQKLNRLEEKRQLEEQYAQRQALLQKLDQWTDGQASEMTWTEYPPQPFPAIEEGTADQSTRLKMTAQRQQVDKAKLALAQSAYWPDLTFGFNYQGVANANYYGFYGGISLPLWSKVPSDELQEAQVRYWQEAANDQQSAQQALAKQKKRSLVKLEQHLTQYRRLFEDLPTEADLRTSLRAETISPDHFRADLEQRRIAEDRLLELEYELQQAQWGR